MRLINALIAAWKCKSTEEKIKTVMHGILMIGGGAVGNTIGDKCSAGRGRIESACARVTGWVLGGVVADTAAKASDEYIDQVSGMIRERRKEKEGTADA